jgi:hypothetical protein
MKVLIGALVVVLFMPGVALAQSGVDVTPWMTLLKDTLTAVLLSVLTAGVAWVSAKVSAWTSGRIDLDAVTRDLEMDRYARIAADKAFSFAYNRLGVTAEQLTNLDTKNRVLDYAVAFLNNQYPEVIKWIDTDQDGVIDWVESRLFLPEPVALKDVLDGAA